MMLIIIPVIIVLAGAFILAIDTDVKEELALLPASFEGEFVPKAVVDVTWINGVTETLLILEDKGDRIVLGDPDPFTVHMDSISSIELHVF